MEYIPINQEDMTVFLRNIGWRLTCLHPTFAVEGIDCRYSQDERTKCYQSKGVTIHIGYRYQLSYYLDKKHNFPNRYQERGLL